MNKRIKMASVVLEFVFVARCCLAADWIVPLGTPEENRTVSASVTYDNITTSEKIIIRNGAKLATGQSDAVFFTVAAESPASKDYKPDGYWRGPIWAPETMLAIDGLRACGETEFAYDLALRFCRMCRKSGFAENFDAKTGRPLCDPAYTWTASVFLVLAHELCVQ